MSKFQAVERILVEKKNAFVVFLLVAFCSSPAFADVDVSAVAVDTSVYDAIALLVITAAVGFWGVRKALRFIG